MKLLLALILLASVPQMALAISCDTTPYDCQTCNELLDECDLPSTGYDSSTSTNNPNNPCFLFCQGN